MGGNTLDAQSAQATHTSHYSVQHAGGQCPQVILLSQHITTRKCLWGQQVHRPAAVGHYARLFGGPRCHNLCGGQPAELGPKPPVSILGHCHMLWRQGDEEALALCQCQGTCGRRVGRMALKWGCVFHVTTAQQTLTAQQVTHD